MKIGVLTSSRADYGIYVPLQKGIAISYGNTVLEFSSFWSIQKFDLIFCLGDRFEMSAAVQASIPFGVKLAHLHGGETTLGAIDNIYRHQITLASKYHFVSTNDNMQKVKQLVGSSSFIYDVGSLSLSNIETFEPEDRSVFFKNYGINEAPYVLVTFHPETVSAENNLVFAKEMKDALTIICNKVNIIITMPNADTLGSIYRKELNKLKDSNPEKVLLVENFGKANYFNAMFYSTLLIGNTSSGIIEAASFNKYVINVGDRQKGRTHGINVFNTDFDSVKIIKIFNNLINKKDKKINNLYFKTHTARNIIKVLKKI